VRESLDGPRARYRCRGPGRRIGDKTYARGRPITRDVKPSHVLLDLLLIVFFVVSVGLFGVFWFPLLLLVVVVVLSLWLVRRYYLDYLDEPEAGRTGP